MSPAEIRERVRAQVVGVCRTELRDEDDIFDMGLLSSLHALRLVQAIEREFCFDLPDDELRLSSFRSIDAIAAMVARLVAR
jgi:methoxymalonate biosynthesis acyl carrier protein